MGLKCLPRWLARSQTRFPIGKRLAVPSHENFVYPFSLMDCINYKVWEDGQILNCVAYIELRVTVDGYKDVLSITVGANENSKF